MTTLTLEIPESLLQQLNQLAEKEGKPVDEIALSAIEQRVGLDKYAVTEEEKQEALARLQSILGDFWEEQRRHPERFQPRTDDAQYGDEYEREFAKIMDEKQREERARWTK